MTINKRKLVYLKFILYICRVINKKQRNNMNFLQNLYTGKRYSTEINWEYIESIPEISCLKNCEQNPRWHSEGNVWNHTKLAYAKLEDEVFSFGYWTEYTDDDMKIIRAAVILHDIGKGVTTALGKDGNWHSYGHEIEGEKIARVLLWNEDIVVREMICSLIRYHMDPLKLFDNKNWVIKMFEIASRIPWKFLYAVKMADLLGSVQQNGGTMKEDLTKMELIKETAKTLGIWDSCDPEKYKDIIKYSKNRQIVPWKVNKDGETKVAYLLIGIPGAGKNTWIEKNLSMVENLANISRDDIRIELGYCSPGEKYVGTYEEECEVTKVYNEKLEYAINNSKCIVLNNVHNKKKYREASVKLLQEAGFRIFYIYIEAPTLEFNYKRREGQIPEETIKAMALSFEFPEPGEYDNLIIQKQTW